MEFRILGPLEVVEDGRPISIRRGKEQALLAYLLLHANEVVPSGTLIDVLWDETAAADGVEDSPERCLPPAQAAWRRPAPDEGSGVPAARRKGRARPRSDSSAWPAKAVRAEALALWRGTPLLDLRDERFADEARRRLEEQRLAVIEDRVDADLAAGRHADLIPELEALVAANPLRERPVGQLDAGPLPAPDARATHSRPINEPDAGSREELGLEPGPQLQELERRDSHARSRARRSAVASAPRGAATPTAAEAPSLRRPRGRCSSRLPRSDFRELSVAAPRPLVQQNSLVVIDPSRNRIVGVVPVGHTPRGVAVGRDYVWVANSADGTISQIGKKSLSTVQTIGLGEQATDLVESAGSVWVATGIDNTLVQLDARSGGIQERLHLSSKDPTASAHAVTAGAGAIWVASGADAPEGRPDKPALSLARKHGCRCCCRGRQRRRGRRRIGVDRGRG